MLGSIALLQAQGIGFMKQEGHSFSFLLIGIRTSCDKLCFFESEVRKKNTFQQIYETKSSQCLWWLISLHQMILILFQSFFSAVFN